MKTRVMHPSDYTVEPMPWGSLTWFVSKAQGNSETLTVGCCRIHPGQANPVHLHPNCDEVLHVLQGTIRHSMENGQSVEMRPGDTISVPAHVEHNASNIGTDEAVLMICFSSAERKTERE